MRINYPKGFRKNGFAKIAINIPEALFDDAIERAKKENKTFNQMVIDLLKCGKLCLDESDQYEPKAA